MLSDCNGPKGFSVSVRTGQTPGLVGESGISVTVRNNWWGLQLLKKSKMLKNASVFSARSISAVVFHFVDLPCLCTLLGLVSILFDCSITEKIQHGDNSRELLRTRQGTLPSRLTSTASPSHYQRYRTVSVRVHYVHACVCKRETGERESKRLSAQKCI